MPNPSRQARQPAGGRLAARRHMQGLSLIEILVSVVILGIGLLGVAAMQSLALRGGQSSLEASQAVMQSNAIIEAMRANRAAVQAGAYNTDGMVCVAGAGGTLAQNDLANWITTLKRNISQNEADATTCGSIAGCPNACVVSVQWDDSRSGGGNTRTFLTRTRI